MSIDLAKRQRRSGFTLVEFLVSFSLTVMCLGALMAVYTFSSLGFQAAFNYVELHQFNRTAMDYLTRDVRQANRVTAYTTNSLTLEDADGTPLVYAFSPTARTFTRTKGANSKVLLRQCDQLSFRLGERNPVGGSYDVYPAATVATAKVVDVSWHCSRPVKGSLQNTEAVQTARIVIRKQGT